MCQTLYRYAVCVVLAAMSTWASAQDCGCRAGCYGSSAQCVGGSYGSCVSTCQVNAQIAADRADAQELLSKESKELIPAFRRARDKLRSTDPISPEYMGAFRAYTRMRKQKDRALLAEYGTRASLASLATGGAEFQGLDDKYLVPEVARQAFHQFALGMLKSAVEAGPRAFGGRADKNAQMEEFGGGRGTYFAYVKAADEAEMSVWPKAHGTKPPTLDLFGLPEPPKARRNLPMSEMSARERSELDRCNKETTGHFPGRRSSPNPDDEMNVYYRACTSKIQWDPE